VRFEWDLDKAATNFRKHGVAFDEASTVFGDKLARTDADLEHSEHEERFSTIGMSTNSRLVAVWHADRTDELGEYVVRIIGARPPTSAERRAYESEE
jgi:uncharacterized DUF497 family protein